MALGAFKFEFALSPSTMSLEPNPLSAIKDVVQHTAKANKDHQYALKVYTERLQAELEVVNKLLVRNFQCSI